MQKQHKTRHSKSSSSPPKIDIKQLVKQLKQKTSLSVEKQSTIIRDAASILRTQPNLLRLTTNLVIVGDLHGQFYDLLNIFQMFDQPPKSRYLFLGDYVDRGRFCIQLITLLLALKINYPNDIFLLRGNHEGRSMTTFFNFKNECEHKYNSQIYEQFLDLFKTLPICAIIDDRYFAVHAGISPKCRKISDIQKMNRFIQIPMQGALCDLLWSDPIQEDYVYWMKNSNRSCSYFYSRNHSKHFLKQNALCFIIRGHEVSQAGYKYQLGTNKQPLTLTIFSAPHYCDSYDNQGAVVVLNGKNLSVETYKAVSHPFVLSNYMNAIELTMPLIATKITNMFASMLKDNGKIKVKRRRSRNDEEVQKTLKQLETIDQKLEFYASQLVIESSLNETGSLHQSSMSETKTVSINTKCAKQLFFDKFEMIGPRNVEFRQIKVCSDVSDDCVPEFQ